MSLSLLHKSKFNLSRKCPFFLGKTNRSPVSELRVIPLHSHPQNCVLHLMSPPQVLSIPSHLLPSYTRPPTPPEVSHAAWLSVRSGEWVPWLGTQINTIHYLPSEGSSCIFFFRRCEKMYRIGKYTSGLISPSLFRWLPIWEPTPKASHFMQPETKQTHLRNCLPQTSTSSHRRRRRKKPAEKDSNIVKRRRGAVCQIIEGTGQAKNAFFWFRFQHSKLINIMFQIF